MIHVIRNRPDDPIKFLSDYLRKHSDREQEMAAEVAKKQFYDMLSATTTTPPWLLLISMNPLFSELDTHYKNHRFIYTTVAGYGVLYYCIV